VKTISVQKAALAEPQWKALCASLLSSPLIAESTLNGSFQSSRGFGMTFTAQGFDVVKRRFPAVFEAISPHLGEMAARRMKSFLGAPVVVPNAWYLNLLLVPPRAHVARHIDATLRRVSQVDNATPVMVTVWYLSVPKAREGALCLWRGEQVIKRFFPKQRDICTFRGDLPHSVEPYSQSDLPFRASVVVEQYHFEADALARFAPFHLESRSSFETFLSLHRNADQLAPKGFGSTVL
jgi:hypothetical protein